MAVSCMVVEVVGAGKVVYKSQGEIISYGYKLGSSKGGGRQVETLREGK